MLPIFLAIPPHDAITTPYWQREPLAIRKVTPALPQIPQFEVEELRVDLSATFDNPFDPEDVRVDAEVTAPSGKKTSVPGFFYRSFERSGGPVETLKAAKSGDWRVRVNPDEVGTYTVSVRLADQTGEITSEPAKFEAVAATGPGIVRISSADHRYFETEGGKSFFPIGANVCWGGDRGTASYDDWLPKYGAQGVNLVRFWLGPEWVTFGMEPAGHADEGKGLGQFDLGNCWRLDYALDLARKNGINAVLAFDSYNILRNLDGYPWWEKSPQNSDNGGPIRVWTGFWTNAKIDQFYRNKLRYIVARWGAYANVFSWEFWNEVDVIRDFDPVPVQAWHRRMAAELKKLDPYNHLVATSFGDSMGVKDIDLLPELDLVNTHHYGSSDLVSALALQQSRKASWGKPHLVEEIGADSAGPRTDADPEGLQIHDPLWISLVTGGSGTAMPWWWDSLIEPKNLYTLFGAVHRFTEGIDFPRENFRQTDVTMSYQTPPKVRRAGDLEIGGGPESWNASEFNRPRTVYLSGTKLSGQLPISGVIHGTRNHRDLINPVQFVVNLSKPTRFEVQIQEVSGYGGAGLGINLDGHRVLTRAFADPDEDKDPTSISKFNGAYGLTIPAGRHTILVGNLGADWFKGTFRFVGVIPQVGPPVSGWALLGNDTAVGWVRVQGRGWRAICESKKVPPAAPPTVFRIKGLRSGPWKVELWDTWTGTVSRTTQIWVGPGGILKVPLPTIAKDIAIRARVVSSQ